LPDRLFTPRFFVMCGFSFTVFLSAFQLLPTAPYHILDLGGTTFASGLFLGFLTYSSSLSAPLTGAFVDRTGQRRVLIVSSVALSVFSVAYALITDYRVMLALVLIHGIFWSALLSASAAYMTGLLPETRRAEGIGYWGLSTLSAIAVAPTVGFWIYRAGGWLWLCVGATMLNVGMAAIATSLPEQQILPAASRPRRRRLVELRVLLVSLTLALYSFGYGGITSFTAMYADANGVTPKSLYLTALAIVMLFTRPPLARLGDRYGYKRVFVPCLVLISFGLACLSAGGTRPWMLLSALIFGVGFGSAYPSYIGYVMKGVTADRRRSRLRRNSRGVRLRHWDRIDDDGVGDSALRFSRSVWSGSRTFRVCAAVLSCCRSVCGEPTSSDRRARKNDDRHWRKDTGNDLRITGAGNRKPATECSLSKPLA
jgi:MFS family permease